MKRSIKSRLIGNFVLIILITVIFIEVVLITGIKDYYYKNVEDILSSQVEFSTNFYERYFAGGNLNDILIDDIDSFWQQTKAQVQIANLEGEVLMDSIGANIKSISKYQDFTNAIEKGKGVWLGNVPYSSEPVIAVSMPIVNRGETIGILRFVSSLEQTNTVLEQIAFLLLVLGVIIIIISFILSLFLANTIVQPLLQVTKVAEKMANGELKVRSDCLIDDDIGKLARTLNQMAEEILKKETLKNDFISSISHELRTPLTSIKGWAVTLRDSDIQDKELIGDGLNIIEKESDRLSNMVEDLLDFSRFTSGRISLVKDAVDVKEVIKHVVYQLLPRSIENGVDLNVEVDEDLGPVILDENRFKQVLINILDNAIKFSEQGRVDLNAKQHQNNLVVTVSDNGAGISKEDLPFVKDKFYKGKNSKSHSGLGLSICNEIVLLHDGELIIESELGVGTKVTLSIPMGGIKG